MHSNRVQRELCGGSINRRDYSGYFKKVREAQIRNDIKIAIMLERERAREI